MFRFPPEGRVKVAASPAAERKVLILADGAIAPTCAGAAAIAQDAHGVLLALANRSLPRMTNNEAEYAGLVIALEMAARFKAVPIEIQMDSEVVVYQMIGRFSVNSAALKIWHRKACVLARAIPQVTYRHIPREQNRLADALAADAVAGRLWMMGSGAP
ncbi:MAG: reverse transcriptase-like protein [Anaerolineae bacterium]|nr:reverse transcriptase-like protein [Anaerolineae bacterium]